MAKYVNDIIEIASCTSTSQTCNTTLRSRASAPALDVHFSTPTLGGNRIGAWNGLGGAQQPIGAFVIDLTNSGGSENVSSAFGGATSMTVLQMLQYQNVSDPAVDAGAVWYSQMKALQVLAKDAFDAINNQKVFGP